MEPKKSQLYSYSSLWKSYDELCGGMNASQQLLTGGVRLVRVEIL